MASLKTPFSFLIFIVVSSLLVNFSYCFNPKLIINASLANGFSNGVATTYGPPDGPGSEGGACGFGNAVSYPPFNKYTAAGNSNDLFKNGSGCGACYQVVCNSHPACSGNPITITIMDECPGSCNDQSFHFDLSGTAMGALAKPGQADALRGAGVLNIGYQRVSCNYGGTKIAFKVDAGSNPFYLSFVTEFVNGDGDLGYIEVQESGSGQWIGMDHIWGATWKANFPNGSKAPYSIRVTTATSRQQIVASNAIPANWGPGNTYYSNVNF